RNWRNDSKREKAATFLNLKVVGANGFEPSTSWSRTRGSKFLKPCRCRAYDPYSSQNLPLVGPHGPHVAWLTARRRSRLVCVTTPGVGGQRQGRSDGLGSR